MMPKVLWKDIPSSDKTIAEFKVDKQNVQNNTLFTLLSEIYAKHFLNVEQSKRNSVVIDYTVEVGEFDRYNSNYTKQNEIKITNLRSLVQMLNSLGMTFEQMSTKAISLSKENNSQLSM